MDEDLNSWTDAQLLDGWAEKREGAPCRNVLMKRARAAGFVKLSDYIWRDESAKSDEGQNKFALLYAEIVEANWPAYKVKIGKEVIYGIIERYANEERNYDDLPDDEQRVIMMAENYFRLYQRAKGAEDKDYIFPCTSPMRNTPKNVVEMKQMIKGNK